MSSPSLYRRILGARFDELPEVLRRFHDDPKGGRAAGRFEVVRGAGWLRNALATVLRFPKSGSDVPVILQVVVENDRERWIRHFGQHRLESVQWAHGDLLMEGVGPSSFSCKLEIEGNTLRYHFQKVWFLGIPVPRPLAPYVDGHVEVDGPRWRSTVRIYAPLLGELVSYDGWATPE